MRNKAKLYFVCVLFAGLARSREDARAEVPTRLEPLYADAVLAYNGKEYSRAIALLDELLRLKPGVVEALELKALALKAGHEDASSAETYRQLIQAKLDAGKSDKDVAPYRYELGLIRFREGRSAEARELLGASLAAGFNEPACRFFLGLMDFRAGALDEAEGRFREVSASGGSELKAAADFYLGQIYSRIAQPSSATQRYFAARNEARDVLEDGQAGPEARKIAERIHAATQAALQPFDRSGWFGNVGISAGYDSNALSVPSSALSVDPNGNEGPSTGKVGLQGGVGYSSSPLGSWQFVPSYRGMLSLNSSGDTKSAEFFVNDASVYVTRNALARFSYGAKAEVVYVFQNGGESRFHFGSYSLSVPFGPYLRYELAPKLSFSAELYLSPQHFFLDSDESPSTNRSGLDKNLRLSLRNERGDRYFNPSFSLILDANDPNTDGRPSEFQSFGPTFELSNVFRPTEALQVALALDASFPRYDHRSGPARQDRIYAADLNGLYRLSPQYALIGDIQYVDNQSTLESLYQFKRFVVSLGASYTF